jgi:hypothetical protein
MVGSQNPLSAKWVLKIKIPTLSHNPTAVGQPTTSYFHTLLLFLQEIAVCRAFVRLHLDLGLLVWDSVAIFRQNH